MEKLNVSRFTVLGLYKFRDDEQRPDHSESDIYVCVSRHQTRQNALDRVALLTLRPGCLTMSVGPDW